MWINLSNWSWFVERDAAVEFFKLFFGTTIKAPPISKPNKTAATSTVDNSKTWQQIPL